MNNLASNNFQGGFNKNLHGLSSAEREIVVNLMQNRIVDDQQLAIVIQEYKKKQQDLPSILMGFGFVTHSKMEEILKKHYNIQNATLDRFIPNIELMRNLHKNTMVSNRFVPFQVIGDEIHVATSEPMEHKVRDVINLSFAQKYKISLFYAPSQDILHFISSAYLIAENKLEKTIKLLQDDTYFGSENSALKNTRIEDNSIVEFISSLFEDAVLKNVSDIHIEPQEQFIRFRYRIDGKLASVIHINKQFWNAISIRIKVLSHMNIAETRKPQDGRIEMVMSGRPIDFRLSCQPGIYGEKFVIRILDKSKSLVSLERLGFSSFNYRQMKKAIERPSGITIITGPTGSGKTTTLYSVLSYLNNVDTNIMTLEDPVEYTVPLVFQTQVKDGSLFDFEDGVRSAMRQDPDILLIGEIRDKPTAEAALRASLTGHKVLTTLHTVDAMTTIQRLVDIGIERYMISGNLDSVIAQRLARILCPSCKTPQTEFSETEKAIMKKYSHINFANAHKANGCQHCRFTGYRGRTSIAEILHITPELDDGILNSLPKHKMLEIAKKQGFRTIQDDALLKVADGLISMEDARMSVVLI